MGKQIVMGADIKVLREITPGQGDQRVLPDQRDFQGPDKPIG
jgi:hypothetical protein